MLSRFDPTDTLTVIAPEETRTRTIVAGDRFEVEGASIEVASIRNWSGLLRMPQGRPMANVALERGEEEPAEGLILSADAWTPAGDDMVLLLRWFESEQVAREALGSGLKDLRAARWGVVEGDSVHWFESFAPGSGVDLSDGASVTLLRAGARFVESVGRLPALLVCIERDGERDERWVLVNRGAEGDLVLFEDLARREWVVLLAAWRDGLALVRAVHNGQPEAIQVIDEGRACALGAAGRALRLDQVMGTAAVVFPGDSTAFEAVLDAPDRTLRVREGEAVRYGDTRLTFDRDERPAVVRYTFSRAAPGPERPFAFSLDAGQSVHYEGWRCLLYTSPSPRDRTRSRMPSSA